MNYYENYKFIDTPVVQVVREMWAKVLDWNERVLILLDSGPLFDREDLQSLLEIYPKLNLSSEFIG